MAAQKAATKSFEASLKELETIVEKMESSDLPLDESLKCLERGLLLSKNCSETLKQAEQKVRVLLKKDGDESLEPFTGKAAAEKDDTGDIFS